MKTQPTDRFVRRTRPWVWGLVGVGLLSGLGWVGDPVGGSAVTVDPIPQLGRIALVTGVPMLLVGALLAFIPGRHVILRTVLLVLFALYVAGMGALFTFRATGDVCGAGLDACGTSAVSRIIGLAGLTAAWVAGLVTEEIVRTLRRRRD